MLVQMAGRVLRAKKQAWLLDLRGVTHIFGDPTEDMVYSLDGVGIRPKGKRYSFCAVCGDAFTVYPCQSCGWAPPEPDLPKIVPAEIKFAGKRSETIDQKRATYKRWAAEAKAKGHKPGAAMYKFKAVYGFWPPKEVMR
jgi:hypothetical protein